MTIPFSAPPPRPDLPLVTTQDGRPTLPWVLYLPQLDAAVRALAGGQVGDLTNAANDAAAAAAGVEVGSIYRSGSVLMVRVA